MRQTRALAQGVWYEIRSQINNRERILSLPKAASLFAGVFRKTMRRFSFGFRGLRFEADRLSFYIKPEDGMELPAIMQWLKQTFAQRYNALTGRTGHIWGDRYWSLILEGEPVEEEEAALEAGKGDRPHRGNGCAAPDFPPFSPHHSPPRPAKGPDTAHRPAESLSIPPDKHTPQGRSAQRRGLNCGSSLAFRARYVDFFRVDPGAEERFDLKPAH
ncbi:MAG: transposase [Treponema sp.]|jgi:hypothetical protein|nr:transposase [Treponema sp.]